MTSQWTLPAAFGITHTNQLVSFVGGGGKTSLMFTLAAELPGRVVITTTTRIFAAQMHLAAAVCLAGDLGPLAQQLDRHGSVLVIGRVDGEKAMGVDPGLPGQLLARPDVDFVLVEADGARMRPIKAPADHEPVIPPQTTILVPVAGIDALDASVADVAHRPELVLERLGMGTRPLAELVSDGRLTPAGMAELLASPWGGLKSTPVHAAVVPFINKVETERQQEAAHQVSAEILRRSTRIERVVSGAVRTARPVQAVHRRVGAVVLAAGESRRMGRNKLLLPWGGSTVLEQTVAQVGLSRVDGAVIVTGYESQAVEDLDGIRGTTLIHNPEYTDGMLSSVQAAIRRAPAGWSAILVVLGDQPMVGPETINSILTAYNQTTAGLIVPRHGGQRGNPVLIDRRYFAELLLLPPDSAPRLLLGRYPEEIAWVDTADEGILQDLDRPEDYARWYRSDAP